MTEARSKELVFYSARSKKIQKCIKQTIIPHSGDVCIAKAHAEAPGHCEGLRRDNFVVRNKGWILMLMLKSIALAALGSALERACSSEKRAA
jgi:hypothetical protein